MKRWLICLFMLVAVLVLAAPARAEEFSGTCGEGLTWSLDQSTGKLTISGEGAMEDYPFSAPEEKMAPWNRYRGKITSVVMEPGITHIGSNAFLSQQALVSVTIADTVTSIGQCAFYECTALEKIVLPDSITEFDYSTFAFCASLTEAVLPDDLKMVPIRMFEGCKALAKIDLPEGVASIEYGAFLDCESLMNIRIPDTVTVINDYAFKNCEKLHKVVFMGPAPNIERKAFEYSYPAIYYPAGDTSWTQEVKDKVDGNLDWVAVDDPAGVKLPEPGDVLEGGCGPDAKWRLEKGTLTITGTGAVDSSKWFGYRGEITTVVVGSGIIDFGNVAHSNVVNITLPDTLTVIGNGAFRGCEKLEQISIPAGVTQIGSGAFDGCISLKRIVIPSGVKRIEANTFCNCDALVEVVLPDALEYIADRAFQSCDNLPKIVFPKNLKTIGDYAFVGCKKLQTVIFQGDAPIIYQFAFNELYFYAYYPAGNKTWNESVFHSFLGNMVWIAGSGETSGTCGAGLTWKIEGDTLTICGNGRMNDYHSDAMGPWTGNNAQIKRLVIEEGVTYIGQCAFYLMSGIKTVELPNGLQEIAGEAFAGCSGIEVLRIPDTVTHLGNYCFSSLIYLRELTLGEGLETIGEEAFFSCVWLEKVTFPATLKSVGRYAFAMCSRLKTATFLGPAPTIAADAFELANVTIYYPAREESWNDGLKDSLWYVKDYVQECIPEHTMGQWEVTKEPTVDLYGEEMRKCIYCDEFEVRDVPKLQPEEPDPTQPTQPQATEPTQPNVTEPNATEPTQADSPDGKRDKPALNGLAIAVIAASVLAAAGAVALAVHTKRSE